MSAVHRLLCLLSCAVLSWSAVMLSSSRAEAVESGFRGKAELAFRYQPIGLTVFNELAYRFKLSDSDSLLFKDTYLDAGMWNIVSPAYIRTGGYFEMVPIAVLQIRGSAQYHQSFGTFGFLYDPPDNDNPTWEIDDFAVAADEGLGIAAPGLMTQLKVTPRVKIDRFVAFVDILNVYVRMDIDETYYEPYYDTLLEPSDMVWYIRPTIGYLPIQNDNTFLLSGVRYERMFTRNSDIDTNQIAALFLYGLPRDMLSWGRLDLVVLGGYWITHPTQRNRTPFIALKFGVTFGAN